MPEIMPIQGEFGDVADREFGGLVTENVAPEHGGCSLLSQFVMRMWNVVRMEPSQSVVADLWYVTPALRQERGAGFGKRIARPAEAAGKDFAWLEVSALVMPAEARRASSVRCLAALASAACWCG